MGNSVLLSEEMSLSLARYRSRNRVLKILIRLQSKAGSKLPPLLAAISTKEIVVLLHLLA